MPKTQNEACFLIVSVTVIVKHSIHTQYLYSEDKSIILCDTIPSPQKFFNVVEIRKLCKNAQSQLDFLINMLA